MRIHTVRGKVPLVSSIKKSRRLVGYRSSSKPVVFTPQQIAVLNQTLKGN